MFLFCNISSNAIIVLSFWFRNFKVFFILPIFTRFPEICQKENLTYPSMLQVNTPRICARLIWAIAEHIDLEGLDPLLADDPDDPLNIIISNIHKVLFMFNMDTSAEASNRLQDVQSVLLSAQRLGSRNARAGQLLIKELEEFRNNSLADSVNKHQCRLILQRIKYVTSHPDNR